jgi:hypothetical protein
MPFNILDVSDLNSRRCVQQKLFLLLIGIRTCVVTVRHAFYCRVRASATNPCEAAKGTLRTSTTYHLLIRNLGVQTKHSLKSSVIFFKQAKNIRDQQATHVCEHIYTTSFSRRNSAGERSVHIQLAEREAHVPRAGYIEYVVMPIQLS